MEVSGEAPQAASAQSPPRRAKSRRQRSRSGRRMWLPSMPRRHTTDVATHPLSQRLQGDGAAGSESSHPAQSAAGPGVMVVANQELEEYALRLRQQYGLTGDGRSGGLPAVMLRVADAPAGAAAPPLSRAGSLSTVLPGGVSPPPSGRSPGAAGASPASSGGGGRLPFRNFWSRSRSLTGAGVAAEEEEIQPGDGHGGSSGELNEHEQSVCSHCQIRDYIVQRSEDQINHLSRRAGVRPCVRFWRLNTRPGPVLIVTTQVSTGGGPVSFVWLPARVCGWPAASVARSASALPRLRGMTAAASGSGQAPGPLRRHATKRLSDQCSCIDPAFPSAAPRDPTTPTARPPVGHACLLPWSECRAASLGSSAW